MQTKQYRNSILVIILLCLGINTGKAFMELQKSRPTDSIMNLYYNDYTYPSTLQALAKLDKAMANKLDSSVRYMKGLPYDWAMTATYIDRMNYLHYRELDKFSDMVEQEYMIYDKINKKFPGTIPTDTEQPIMVKKPVVYIYPRKEQKIDVMLGFKGTELYTWPKIDDDLSWSVTAQPNGMLSDDKGNEYPYLFWEGVLNDYTWIDKTEGFVVPADETESFLLDKLKYLGLNSKEYTDFITYWAPQLRKNAFNMIRFETTEYSAVVPLNINPKPESMQRIMMVFHPLDEAIDIKPQVLQPFTRKGYTVIEWGGMQMPELID